jgi:hypothetical protein
MSPDTWTSRLVIEMRKRSTGSKLIDAEFRDTPSVSFGRFAEVLPDFSNEHTTIKIELFEDVVTIVPVVLPTSRVDPKNEFQSIVMHWKLPENRVKELQSIPFRQYCGFECRSAVLCP